LRLFSCSCRGRYAAIRLSRFSCAKELLKTCHSTLDSEKELTDSSRLDPPPDGAFGLGRAFVVVTRGSARRELVFGSVEVVVVVVVVVVEDFVVELGVEDLG
jgi:hypothetical protein